MVDEVMLDAMVLAAVVASPWEQGQARAELSCVPEGELAAEVSLAIDLMTEPPFDAVPGDETVRCAGCKVTRALAKLDTCGAQCPTKAHVTCILDRGHAGRHCRYADRGGDQW